MWWKSVGVAGVVDGTYVNVISWRAGSGDTVGGRLEDGGGDGDDLSAEAGTRAAHRADSASVSAVNVIND